MGSYFFKCNLYVFFVLVYFSSLCFSKEINVDEKVSSVIKAGEAIFFEVKLNKDDLIYVDLQNEKDALYLQVYNDNDVLIGHSGYYYSNKSNTFRPENDSEYKIKISNLSDKGFSNYDLKVGKISNAEEYGKFIDDFELWLNSNLVNAKEVNWQFFLKNEDKTKVIAFGEPTHGGSEFWQQRLELAKAMAHAGQLHIIGLEMSFSEINAMNDYVHSHSIFSVRPRFGFPLWNKKSIDDFFEGIRKYNSVALEKNKIELVGIDLHPTEHDLDLVQEFFDQLGLETAVKDIFNKKWVELTYDTQRSGVVHENLNQPVSAARELLNQMKVHQHDWQAKTSVKLYQQAWLLLNARMNLLKPVQVNDPSSLGLRDQFLAEQVKFLANNILDNKKILLYAHNFHVAKASSNGYVMGWYLKESFGSKYKVIAGDFNYGEFFAVAGDSKMSRIDRFNVEKSSPESLESYLSKSRIKQYVLPLSNLSVAAEKTLNRKILMRSVGAQSSEKIKNEQLISVVPRQEFDYIFFVDNQSAL